MGWKKIKLGEVLIKKNLRLKDVPDLKNPLVIGVTNDEGVVKSKVNAGQKIEDYYVVEKGDFIYNPYRINVGSIGISDLEGITSLAYVVFKVDETRLNKYLLYKFLKSDLGIKEIIRNGRGSVRNALRFDDLAKIELTLPSIEVQNAFVENFKKKEEKLELLKQHYSYQLTLIEQLNQAILQEAVQGKLVKQDPKDEPASELLKRIKAEKATLRQAQGKGKKEKPLPPIKPEEIPFEIPENWVWCRLGEIISISSGDGLTSYQMVKSGNIPVYGGNGINGYHSKFNIDSKRIVIGRVGAYCGAVHITEDKGWVTDNAFIVSYSVENIDFNWLAFFLKALDLNKLSYKGNQPVISGARVYPLVVPLPPLSEQKRIVAEIEKQFALTKQLKEHIIANQQATEQLLKALLHQAFEVKEMVIAKPKGKVIELKPTNVDYYRRTVLAAEIVWQLHKEPTLGHLKLQKLIYLCQKSADMQLPTNFLRQAMGPYDNRLMRSIDKQLKEKKWFEYKKEQVLKYQPLEKAGQHHNDFLKYFSAESEGIQFIIDKFRNVLSREIEIWATLYACMDNMLNENVIFSEASLLQRFYEWSEEKKKFSEEQIKRVFSRMKETGIIPKGFNL